MLQKVFNKVDACGVHNLHGMPGIFGGIVAIFAIPGIAKAQLAGIVCTVVLALVSGYIGGYVIRIFGKKQETYQDSDEFVMAEEPSANAIPEQVKISA